LPGGVEGSAIALDIDARLIGFAIALHARHRGSSSASFRRSKRLVRTLYHHSKADSDAARDNNGFEVRS
jgi:hypothetical protein